jgi:polyisoprenoid-binding protein YceI
MRVIHPLTIAALLLGSSHADAADLQESTLTLHVHRKGLFSSGTDYTIVAPVATSMVDVEHRNVDIVVRTDGVKFSDPAVSARVRRDVEEAMRGPRVLDVAAYPEIHFTAAEITEAAPGQYRATGTLELHGIAQQLVFDFGGTPTHYHGRATVHASDFGIPPLTFAGGLVRIKDDIVIEFDLFGAAGESNAPAIDHDPQ